MRKYTLLLCTALFVMLSCNKTSMNYNITASILDAKADTAYLYTFEPMYNSIRLINQKPIYRSRKVSFIGEYTGNKIAFIKLGKDTVPYYFSLDSIPTSLQVGERRMGITSGSNTNKRYIQLYGKVDRLQHNKRIYQHNYLLHLNDSTLTEAKEKDIIKNYDKTEQQLQRLIMTSLKKNEVESYLTWRKFGKYIPKENVPKRYKKAED